MKYAIVGILSLLLIPAIADAGDRHHRGHRSGLSINVSLGYSDYKHSYSRHHRDRHVSYDVHYSSGKSYRAPRYERHHHYSAPRIIYRSAPVYCPPPVIVYERPV